jgi:hypothetical protein
MKRLCLLFSALGLLLACQEEIIVHDSSLVTEFSRMNKEGWQVTRNDQPTPTRTGDQADPNVRVIRQADFSGYQFNTNFEVNDPRYPQTRPVQLSDPSPTTQPANPFSALPRLPGM